MSLRTFMAREEAKVMVGWRKNELSMLEAVRGLVRLGYSADQAWSKLSNEKQDGAST